MKKIIIIITLLILFIPVIPSQSKTVSTKTYGNNIKLITQKKGYGKYTVSVYWKNKRYNTYGFTRQPKIKFISIKKLTYKQLVSRKKTNTLYVEISIGRQINRYGDGKILNTPRPGYDYIRYHGFHKGDIIRTYCIYNPYNNWEDDIIDRFDEKNR